MALGSVLIMLKLIVTALAALTLVPAAGGAVFTTNVDLGGGGYHSLYDYCAQFGWNAVYPGSVPGYWCHTPGDGTWVWVNP